MGLTPLFVGGIGTGVMVGGAFGARHAFEADHIAAVATLVEERNRPASTGAAWGVGHSVPILLLGTLFLALDIQLPSGVATVFELLVVGILVTLGLRVLAGHEALGLTILRHVHGGETYRSHRHLTVGSTEVGLGHSHWDTESLAVGVVHGLAGSGGVVIALAAAAPTVTSGAAFLVGFAVASVVAMGAASWLWGRAIGQVRRLRILAGLASIVIGVVLFAQIVGYTPPV